MNDTEVVDAHVHLWDPDELPYPWLEGTDLRRRFDAADLASAAAPVRRFVAVQADSSAGHSVEEVEWLTRTAGDVLLGVVAHAPVERGAGVREAIENVLAAGPVVGIRRLLQDEPAGAIASGIFDAGLDVVAEFGLPFDLCVRAHQLDEVVDLVARHPEQTMVLDHVGKPRVGDPEALEPWRRTLARLASYPGVAVKLSGLATELIPGAGLDAARPYVQEVLELFGPERCMFGSDWPVMTVATSYAEWRALVGDVLAGLPRADLDAVLGGTARRVYRRTDV